MARNALLVMLFLFLIVFGGSDASFGWELRRLVGADPRIDKTAKGMHDSPSPTSDPKPMDVSGQEKRDSPSTSTAQKEDPVSSNTNISPVPPPVPKTVNDKEPNNSTPAIPPSVTKSDDGKSHGQEIKKDDQTFSQSNTNENCDDLNKCRDDGDVVACISKTDSKYLVVIVQNGGDSVAQVNLSMGSNIGCIEVAKHKNKKINISVTIDRSTELTLNAGKGDCVLHMGTIVPEGGIFLHLPSYEKILTPVNGAYFLILAVLILGATWACCKFRKKRHDGVPYQELEMALPESVSATNVEVAEGWDQDWDDNWDEEVAVKSPGRTHAGSISANGLTARSSNRDGWGNDWDD